MHRRYGAEQTEQEYKTLHAMAQQRPTDIRREAPQVVGSTPYVVALPKMPSNSPWASAGQVPDELPIDCSDCGNTVGVALGGASHDR